MGAPSLFKPLIVNIKIIYFDRRTIFVELFRLVLHKISDKLAKSIANLDVIDERPSVWAAVPWLAARVIFLDNCL